MDTFPGMNNFPEMKNFPGMDNFPGNYPNIPEVDDNSWKIPFIIVGTLIGIGWSVGIFLCFCKCCRACCSAAAESSSEERPRVTPSRPPTFVPEVTPSRPPAFVPPMPSAPPLVQSENPPPYSEIEFKPNIWPLIDRLPAYDNIAMVDLPSSGIPQQPRSNAHSEWA